MTGPTERDIEQRLANLETDTDVDPAALYGSLVALASDSGTEADRERVAAASEDAIRTVAPRPADLDDDLEARDE